MLTERRKQLHGLCEQFGVAALGLFGSALQATFAAMFGRRAGLVELDVMPGSRLKRSIQRSQRMIYERGKGP